jgi:Tfp pilus assembly protein PilO
MTARDRMMLIGIALVAVLGALWFMAVSPARKQAEKASGEVASARSQLAQAQNEAAEARAAQTRYHSAYASLASLGQAVPTTPEVPALVFALDKASANHKVQFSSIATGAGGTKATSTSAPSASSATEAQAAPFTQLPFTFTFAGSYQGLIHLLGQLERFTVQVPGGPVEVSGRLLTIQSITLGSGSGGSSTAASAAPSGAMTWTIAASAYVLAPSASSAGSSASAGAGGPSAGASGAAPSASGPSAATPAVVRAGG